MFSNIQNVMHDQTWIWQQNGARDHKARASDQFLQQSTLDFNNWEDWPSKSPDLNVMDYCIWSLLLTDLQNCRRDAYSVEDLKTSLRRVWNDILQVTFQNVTQGWISMDAHQNAARAWISRLRRSFEAGEWCQGSFSVASIV